MYVKRVIICLVCVVIYDLCRGEQDVPCISNEAATTQYQPDSASVSHWNTITPHPSWIEEKKALSDQIQMLCASQNLGLVALLRSEIEVLKLQLMEMTKIRDSFADNLKEMEAQIELLMKERGILLAQLETSNKNLLYYRWLYVSAAIEQGWYQLSEYKGASSYLTNIT